MDYFLKSAMLQKTFRVEQETELKLSGLILKILLG